MANNVIKRIWNQNTLVNIEALKGAIFEDEDGGHTFEISGVDNSGNAISLSGTVAGVFLRPDNTDVPITGSASGGIVSVTLPAECYDVPGRFGLTVFVTADSQKTCVYAAIGTVGRTSSGSVAPGTSADVVDLINQISAAVATIPASWSGLMADIAPTYSTSAAYPVGAYVYYNGDLYRCTTTITTGETWTAAHWTTAVLGNDVSDLKSAISLTNEGVEPYFVPQFSSVPASDWELGGISSTGEEVSGNYIMRTKNYYPYNPLCEYQYKPLQTATVRFAVFYNEQLGFLERSNSTDIQRDNARFVRFTYGFGASSGTVITDSVKATLASEFGVTITPYIDPEKVKAVADRPVTLSSDVGAMLDVAEGYFKQAYDSSTHLVYDTTHGLFAPQTTSSQSGETGYPAIVCSQFSQALLMGIRYDQSRYVLQNNHRAGWGYITDGTGDYVYTSEDISDHASQDYMIAKQQLKYAMDHGWAYTITDVRKQIRPGDFLFYGTANVASWEDITHVAICLHVGLDDNNMINIESDDLLFGTKRVGVGIKRFPIERSGGHYLYGARFPILPSLISPTLILSDKNLSGTNTSYAIKQYALNGNHPSGFYTAVIDGSFAAARVEVGLHYTDAATNTFDYSRGRVVSNAGRYAVTFYADRNFDQVRLGATANNTYLVNKFCLFKGYYGQDWILPV